MCCCSFFAHEISEVQKSLNERTSTRAPDPIAVSQQYLAALPDANSDDEEHPPPPLPEADAKGYLLSRFFGKGLGGASKGVARKAKGKKCKGSKKKPCGTGAGRKASKAALSPGSPGPYSPHYYAEQRKIFLLSARSEGMNFKAANEAWLASAARARLLSQMSLGELKRRRFVAKGCNHNPFAHAACGA